MENLHRFAAKVKIEIETWNLEDIFFLFISNHMSPVSVQIRKYPKDHPSAKRDPNNETSLYVSLFLAVLKNWRDQMFLKR